MTRTAHRAASFGAANTSDQLDMYKPGTTAHAPAMRTAAAETARGARRSAALGASSAYAGSAVDAPPGL